MFVAAICATSFRTGPSGDDFGMPLMTPIFAARDGLAETLFVPNQPMRYRPLEAVAMYAAQSLPIGDVLVRVRVLHFASFAAYLFGVLAFARAVALGRIGIIVCAATCALHPIQVACFGGMDNFSVHALFAIMFAGMTWLARGRERSIAAIAAATFLTTAASACFKEYGFGTALFAPLVVWFTHGGPINRRLLRAAAVTASAGAAVVLHQSAKHLLLPATMQSNSPAGGGVLHLIPYNLALYGAGSILFGSTYDLVIHPTALRIAWSAALVLMFVAMLGVGLSFAWRTGHRVAADPAPFTGGIDQIQVEQDRRFRRRCQIVLLVACFLPTSLPNVLLIRASEVYLPGVVAILSMLVGVAAELWVSRAKRVPFLPSAVLLALLVCGVTATHAKAAGIREAGDRAAKVLAAVVDALGTEVADGDVALLFQTTASPSYSIFAVPDEETIDQPCALWWRNPTSRVWLISYRGTAEELDTVDVRPFRAAFSWDPAADRFVRLPPAPPRLTSTTPLAPVPAVLAMESKRPANGLTTTPTSSEVGR